MVSVLFEEWVRELNRKFLGEGRKVALIVDNCPAHPHVEGLKAIQLVFLPPNMMQKIQAMDQGVIRLLKAHYRALTVPLFICAIDNNQNKHPISNEYAYCSLGQSVRNNTSKLLQTIGISEQSQECAINDTTDPFKELTEELKNLRERAQDHVQLYQCKLTLKPCSDAMMSS